MPLSGSQPVRVPRDEALSAAAFDLGADEVAGFLVQALFETFRKRR